MGQTLKIDFIIIPLNITNVTISAKYWKIFLVKIKRVHNYDNNYIIFIIDIYIGVIIVVLNYSHGNRSSRSVLRIFITAYCVGYCNINKTAKPPLGNRRSRNTEIHRLTHL